MTGAVAIMLGGAAISISVSPPTASGISSSTTVTSNAVTATVVGGTITSANWIRIDGSVDIFATNPTSATTQFVTSSSSPVVRDASFVYEALVNGVTYQSELVPVNLVRT